MLSSTTTLYSPSPTPTLALPLALALALPPADPPSVPHLGSGPPSGSCDRIGYQQRPSQLQQPRTPQYCHRDCCPKRRLRGWGGVRWGGSTAGTAWEQGGHVFATMHAAGLWLGLGPGLGCSCIGASLVAVPPILFGTAALWSSSHQRGL